MLFTGASVVAAINSVVGGVLRPPAQAASA
jgi:hypothetical protein